MKYLQTLPVDTQVIGNKEVRHEVAVWEYEREEDYGCEYGCDIKRGDVLFGTSDSREPKFCANCFFTKVAGGKGGYKFVRARVDRKMERKLREFIRAGNKLSEVWDNDGVENYPDYLPSFDEFLVEFARLLGK